MGEDNMKITIEVLKDGSVKVGGDAAPDGPFHNSLVNVAALGVLELAKVFLLANRWGIDLRKGGEPFEQEQEGVMKPKLKPCPFCGHKKIISRDANLGWHIGCWNEDCHFQPTDNFEDELSAAKAWNKRAESK